MLEFVSKNREEGKKLWRFGRSRFGRKGLAILEIGEVGEFFLSWKIKGKKTKTKRGRGRPFDCLGLAKERKESGVIGEKKEVLIGLVDRWAFFV